jgi:hypothetical protein
MKEGKYYEHSFIDRRTSPKKEASKYDYGAVDGGRYCPGYSGSRDRIYQ